MRPEIRWHMKFVFALGGYQKRKHIAQATKIGG
jgi:hypothetical protein